LHDNGGERQFSSSRQRSSEPDRAVTYNHYGLKQKIISPGISGRENGEDLSSMVAADMFSVPSA